MDSLNASLQLAEGDPNVARMCQALQKDACPLCTLTAASTQQFIDGFLYESVNDTTLREELARAQGFCYRHAWQVLDAARDGGAGVPVLYSDFTARVIATLRAQLRDVPITQRWSGLRRVLGFWRKTTHARVAALEPRALCLVCRVEREAEAGYVADLAHLLARADFRALYTTSRGVCLPHLRQLCARVDAETCLFLAETTRAKIAALLRHVQEYNRKHIWDFRAEPKLPEEQTAWIRAIAFQVGEKK